MSTLWPQLEPLLGKVQKPARYIGGEGGAQTPQHHPEAAAWLLIYPDTYEIGLPNQGLQILYEILNERDDAVAERAYAPWTDLEAILRTAGLPLFSVDTHRPAADFDVLAFNLSAELVFTNLLNCIDLAGFPVRAADRHGDAPLVVAGGHCTSNPEPLADFVDAFVIGDGEEVVGAMTEVIADWKAGPQRDVDREGAPAGPGRHAGVSTCPSLYDVGLRRARLVSVQPRYADVPAVVEKATIADLAEWPYPKNQLVPLTEVVHDRLNVEVFRGCTRGCRFCQAGMITRPVRERPAEQVRSMIDRGAAPHRLRRGGPHLAVHRRLLRHRPGRRRRPSAPPGDGDGADCSRVSVALPSLRVDAFTVGIAASIQRARRTGLTFAPEAGSWRMRQVINKLISEDDLYGAVESAYSQGWRRMKLYFLTGLPTETDEDTLGIAELARRCVELGKAHHKNPSVTVSLGGFVPKAFTPFQWFGQNTEAELRRKIGLLRDDLRRDRGVQFKWHDPKATLVEGLLSRGDRRLGAVIEDVWRRGGIFQEWSEHFDRDLWIDAIERAGLSMDWYTHRHRTEDEVLPWDHLSVGLHKDFLWQDWRDALGRGRARGLPVDARATTVAPAPATASSTSSPRRCRPPVAARAPARISQSAGSARCPVGIRSTMGAAS